MFERPLHRSVAQVLSALDGPLLRENKCLFGGGTLIALRYGEYRESVDIDFMVSDLAGYRTFQITPILYALAEQAQSVRAISPTPARHFTSTNRTSIAVAGSSG